MILAKACAAQIERRKAERQRAAQLQKLSPMEQKMQLAKELRTAHKQAKAAKASGNALHQRSAGSVIRHLKQEIAASGFKEGEIQELIDDALQGQGRVKSAEDTASDSDREWWADSVLQEPKDSAANATNAAFADAKRNRSGTGGTKAAVQRQLCQTVQAGVQSADEEHSQVRSGRPK
jgi:hypothetical protein